MREINIPEGLQPKLEYYIGLSEAIKNQFVAELSISPLGFTPQALIEHLSAKLPLSNAEISDLVSVAINLISAKDVTNADSGEFVDMLQRALERTDKASLQPSDKILKDFAGLIAINDGTNALATGKVIEQMTDQHKTYLDSKVLHDIRPTYKIPLDDINTIEPTPYENFVKIDLSGKVITRIPKALSGLSVKIEKSKYILQLKDNWDGEGQEGFSQNTWMSAVKFICNYATWIYGNYREVITFPDIYHGPSGSIDLLWDNPDYSLLINFPKYPNGLATFYGDSRHNQKVEGNFDPESFQAILLPSFIKL